MTKWPKIALKTTAALLMAGVASAYAPRPTFHTTPPTRISVPTTVSVKHAGLDSASVSTATVAVEPCTDTTTIPGVSECPAVILVRTVGNDPLNCGNDPVNNSDPQGLSMDGTSFENWEPTTSSRVFGWMSRVQMRAQIQREAVLEASRNGKIGVLETTAKYSLLKPSEVVARTVSLPLAYKQWHDSEMARGHYWVQFQPGPALFVGSGFKSFVAHTGTTIGNLSVEPNGANIAVTADVLFDWLLLEEGARRAAGPTPSSGVPDTPRIGPTSEAAKNAATVGNPIYVLGRRVDTAVAKNWPGHSVLDISDWTLAKNDALIQNIIDQRASVYLGSPQTQATLWDAANNRMTVFARELEQLKAGGHIQVGDFMLPPGAQ
jgi:hypothetical protein